jgi:hypothetical protein
MLDSYHLLLASLDESETSLLEDNLIELRRCIRPGAKRLNWTSLGIQDYLNKALSVSFVHTKDLNLNDEKGRLNYMFLLFRIFRNLNQWLIK